MTITRRGLFDEIDRLDKQIANLQDAKSECFESYRDQMKDEGRKKPDVSDEITACKKAFRRHRDLDKNADAVLSQDALVDEIVAELQKPAGTRNALARAPAPRTCEPEPSENDVSLRGGRTGHTPMRAGCDDNAPLKEASPAETDVACRNEPDLPAPPSSSPKTAENPAEVDDEPSISPRPGTTPESPSVANSSALKALGDGEAASCTGAASSNSLGARVGDEPVSSVAKFPADAGSLISDDDLDIPSFLRRPFASETESPARVALRSSPASTL